MSSVGSGTIHTVAQIITEEEQEENDVIRSENRHPSADDNPLFEDLPEDEELLRQLLQAEEEQVEQEDRDRDRDDMASWYG